MNATTTTQPAAITATADQLAADLRDRRCCDALDPCRRCQTGRVTVHVARAMVQIPAQRTKETR